MGWLDFTSVTKTITAPTAVRSHTPAGAPAPAATGAPIDTLQPPGPSAGGTQPQPSPPPSAAATASPAAAAGALEETKQPLFLEPKTLTFSGVTAAAALIYNFILGNSGWNLDPFLFSGVIAGIVGITLIFIGVRDSENKDSKPKQILTGVINSFLLWISIFGASGAGDAVATALT